MHDRRTVNLIAHDVRDKRLPATDRSVLDNNYVAEQEVFEDRMRSARTSKTHFIKRRYGICGCALEIARPLVTDGSYRGPDKSLLQDEPRWWPFSKEEFVCWPSRRALCSAAPIVVRGKRDSSTGSCPGGLGHAIPTRGFHEWSALAAKTCPAFSQTSCI